MGTIFTVTFPDIGEGVVEGEVIEWRKNVGDVLTQDEPVVVIMTDKATVELPAPHPGVLAKQYYVPGGIAIKGRPLYDIQVDQGIDLKLQTEVEKPQESVPVLKEEKVISKEGERVLATPKVRGMAKALGISLSEIKGSGPDGRIMPHDLLKASPKEPMKEQASLSGDEEQPLIGIRGLMAKRMALSKAKIPHFSYFEQADATRLIQLKNNVKTKASEEGIHITYMPFILKALSLCIEKFPLMNSSFDEESFKVIFHHSHNMGIAVATSLGLIVPVLKGVESLSMESLIREYEKLIHKTHEGQLLPQDMKEGTITVSNFGSHGGHGLWATPVINYPEAAILAIGRIHSQPVAKNGEIVIREMLNVSWSFDHRLIDGEMATHISHHFCRLLENPAPLL